MVPHHSEAAAGHGLCVSVGAWRHDTPVTALIFDFDGLILDTEWPAFVTVAETFERHGVSMSLERWQMRVGRGDNKPWTQLLADDLGTDIDHRRVAEDRRMRKNVMTDAETVRPGVTALLDAADARSIPTAVASSSHLSWVGGHLDRLGLAPRFEVVRTIDDVSRGKPWPDLFLEAAKGLGVDPTLSLAFEDSVHGVSAAKAAGMTCVAVPNRITAGGDFSHADIVVSSLADLSVASPPFLGETSLS